MRIPKDAAPVDPPDVLLIRVLNECQQSQASHRRCMKELVKCRREFPSEFGEVWKRCMFPVFENMKKEAAIERLVKFAASLVTYRDENGDECDAFVEDFVKFLLSVADASNKCVRYRSCQILSEVILTLAEDAEVSAKLWDEMTACMQHRMQDKIPGIRLFAARALARLLSTEDNELENDSTILQYRLCLSSDPNAEVRRAAVLSIPVSNITIADVVERTSDVSDAVRKAAYVVLGTKIPIQSLTIRQRTTLLHRGLVDRVHSVQTECTKMLKDGWLSRDSQMDVMTLLRYLDVETNEKVGELVMQELLKEDSMRIDTSRSLKDYLIPEDNHIGTDQTNETVRFMEPEEALYWRMLCLYLHSEAQAKRLEAANTQGAKADVLEAEAAEKVEILEMILPSTVAEFVLLVEAHYHAGPSHRFVSRQLLMLANLLDFTDTTNRRAAATLINNILHIWTTEEHVSNLMEMIGDGIYLGGEKEWSDAVVQLAHKVHASPGAFEEAMAKVLVDLGRPCREGGANVLEWLQCLAVTGLLLDNLKSLHQLPGHLIDSEEMVYGLLMPAANHLLPEIQRAGIRCLSLYCQLEEKPSMRIVQQLEAALCKGSPSVRIMAVKALFDVVMCHGATLLDKVVGVDLETAPTPKPRPHDIGIPDVAHVLQHDQARQVPVLEALANMLNERTEVDVQEEGETAKSLAAQGFAKLLMQSKLFPELHSLQTTVLPRLLRLYFDEDTKDMPRLRQCLSVFFHNYASVAAEHKKCIAKVFIPLMRVEWPGISGSTGNPHVAAARKKSATQLSRFMLELLKQPLFSATAQRSLNDSKEEEDGNIVDNEALEAPDDGQESLAINLANEIIKVSSKKSAAVKSYKSTLCKVLVSLEFRPSRQEEISCMRKLLDLVTDAMSGEKLILKELKVMASQLKKIHKSSEDVLTVEQLHSLLDSLGLSMSATELPNQEAPRTPAARTDNRKKKQAARPAPTPDSDDNFETPKVSIARAARACKTEALKRMQSSKLTSKSRAIDFESESSGSGGSSDSGVEETDE